MLNIEDWVAEAQSFRTLRRLPDCAKAPQKEMKVSPREDWLFGANRAMCVMPGEETGLHEKLDCKGRSQGSGGGAGCDFFARSPGAGSPLQAPLRTAPPPPT